jgi:hypothetical protein
MTKILIPDYDDRIWPSISIVNVKALVGIPLTSGNPLGQRFPERLAISQNDNNNPPDFFYAGAMPVISHRFAESLKEFECKLELFELDASKLVGNGRYYFLNLLESIDRLDWRESNFTERGGFATKITKLRLLDVIVEPAVYRISKTIPSLISVSDIACRILKEKKLNGFRLVKAEDWENPAAIA